MNELMRAAKQLQEDQRTMFLGLKPRDRTDAEKRYWHEQAEKHFGRFTPGDKQTTDGN